MLFLVRNNECTSAGLPNVSKYPESNELDQQCLHNVSKHTLRIMNQLHRDLSNVSRHTGGSRLRRLDLFAVKWLWILNALRQIPHTVQSVRGRPPTVASFAWSFAPCVLNGKCSTLCVIGCACVYVKVRSGSVYAVTPAKHPMGRVPLEAAGLSYLIHTAGPFVSVTSMVEKEWPERGVIHLCTYICVCVCMHVCACVHWVIKRWPPLSLTALSILCAVECEDVQIDVSHFCMFTGIKLFI